MNNSGELISKGKRNGKGNTERDRKKDENIG
jgi:hypothetical protein